MHRAFVEIGQRELASVRRRSRPLFWTVGLFSLFANLLMFTGPLYMLQIYDRVLGSGSIATLIALSGLVVFMYGIMGVLDYARGRIMARVGARFHADLDRRVFDAVVRKSAVAPDVKTQSGLDDLEAVQRLLASPALLAGFDLPWMPIFFAGIFLFHPVLGALAVAGGFLLFAIAIFSQAMSRNPQSEASTAGQEAAVIADQMRIEAEVVQAMGMRMAVFDHWQTARSTACRAQLRAVDTTGAFSSVTRTLRMFLQSAMLGLGAYLVLQGELSAGAMIAGSILLGRALAPIEQVANQWPVVQRAVTAWANLSELLGAVAPETRKTALPKPKANLSAKSLTVVPPGQKHASIKAISFDVAPGQAVGVIGASGSGKTTLARALTGVWPPAGGSLRLDGAAFDQFDQTVLGQHIGYLPQRVQLFDGSIAQNIARMIANPCDEKVVAAARAAAAHDMILGLPKGYDTMVSCGQVRLSGGQMQRIGLARALYDDPVITVLDEPNSNLDNVGSEALNQAIRALKADGRSVLVMAHRPAAIQECDQLLVLNNGARMAFGPKDEVLAGMVKNHQQFQTPPSTQVAVA
ncbi:MAG: type I secretion system permease/ATPase [Sulfitobacter sp.]